MKKILAILLTLSLLFAFSACGKGSEVDLTDPSIYTIDCMTSMGIWETPKSVEETDAAADALLQKIEANPDSLKPKDGGKYIYVANDGVDEKGNGYDKNKPVATIAYANLLANAGDVVVLKRGNFWRERVVGVAGVSYGAYGTGNKPTVYGSPENLALNKWETTETPNVYCVPLGATANVGAIVFDHGVAVGSLKNSADAVETNYDYYISAGKAYVYCTDGNPGKLYSSIETCSGGHIVKLASDSTIQNWRLMYTGIHGISMGTVKNVEADGCVIGYIGGGGNGGSGRLGNGIEVFGGCDGYIIRNCHVFQCYDAGITMQYVGSGEDGLLEQNILFENNLLEYSVYNIEYFMSGHGENPGIMKDVLIQNNVIRYGGYGWGYHTRPDKNRGTNIQGRGEKNATENFVFKNNIIDHSLSFLMELGASSEEYIPTFIGNKYYQLQKSRIARINDKNYGVKRYGISAITDVLGDATGTLHVYN